MLAKTKVKEIQNAVIIVKKLTRSEEMRDKARREEEGQHDLTMRLNYAYDKGMKKGMEKGAAEEKERSNARIARNNARNIETTVAFMRENNFPEEKIQDYIKKMQESAERDQDDNQE